jgi:hypothetical protein
MLPAVEALIEAGADEDELWERQPQRPAIVARAWAGWVPVTARVRFHSCAANLLGGSTAVDALTGCRLSLLHAAVRASSPVIVLACVRICGTEFCRALQRHQSCTLHGMRLQISVPVLAMLHAFVACMQALSFTCRQH